MAHLYRGDGGAAGYTVDVNAAITIRDLDNSEPAWANEQYRAIEFAVTPPGSVALVAELAGVRVGLGRLVEHAPGVLELGGIWTDPSARGRGIARAMVDALMARLPSAAREADRDAVQNSGADAAASRAAGLTREAGMPYHDAPVWCIPFVHLSAFYQSFGFVRHAPPWPPAIAAKVATCIAQGLEVEVLAR